MQTFNSGGKTPTTEKVIRILFLAGIGYGLLKLWNWIAPTLIQGVNNAWEFTYKVVPLILVGGYIAMNPKLVYMSYLGFCKKITRLIVRMDPLSIMEGYLTILQKKHANLGEVKTSLDGKRIKLQRLVDDKIASANENKRLALAAQKQGQIQAAKEYAIMATNDQNSVTIYHPILGRYNRNCEYMEELYKNWGSSIKTLGHTIDTKRMEFETLKEMFKGLKSAEDFASSDSEEAQLYATSLRELEENVSQRIAYIEDFEKKAKPIMTNMKVQKQAQEDEAMAMLENMIKQDNLKLPNFSVTNGMSKVAETIPYENKYGL